MNGAIQLVTEDSGGTVVRAADELGRSDQEPGRAHGNQRNPRHWT